MICILFGHSPIAVTGKGDFGGRTVMMCRTCGKDMGMKEHDAWPNDTGTSRVRGYEAAAEEFHNER